MARTKINDKQLEKIVSADKVDGQSLNITGSGNALATLTGGDHFLVQSGSSNPQKISADVMQDFFSKVDIVETGTDASYQIIFADDDTDGTGDGILRVDGSHLNYNPNSNLLTVAGNLGLSANEIDVASGNLTLDVAGNISLNADGGSVTIDDASSTLFTFAANEIDVASGDLTLDVAGNISLNADGGSVTMVDASSTLFTFAANEIDVASGDLLLDVAGDIKLDAGGADIILQDDGTESARFTMDGATSIELASAGDIILDPAGNNVLPGSDSADDLGKDAATSTIASGFHSNLASGQTLNSSMAVPFVRFSVSSLPSAVGDILSGDTITITDSNSTFTATASGPGLAEATYIGTSAIASSLKSMTYSASAGSSNTAIRLSSSPSSAVLTLANNDKVTMADGSGSFTATVSGTPSATLALATFLTFNSGQTITASTTSISVSSIPGAVSAVVKSGDTLKLVQGGVTATATLSADPSGSSYAFSGGFTFSGGSSVSTDSSFSTSQFEGSGIPISSVLFADSNDVTFDGDPAGKTANFTARGIPLSGSGSGSASSSDTFASGAATRLVSRVAWREIFVDNVNLNGQGLIKLDDDGDTHIAALSDDVIEFSAGGTHALSVSGSTVDVLVGLVAKGDVDLGDAVTDSVTVTGRFDSDLLPIADSTSDLGSSTLQWAEAHIDHGHIDAITATGTSTLTTVDINGGAIDGTVIGANSAAAGTFAALVATSADINGVGDFSDTLTASKSSGTGLSVSANAAVGGDLQVTGDAVINGDVDLGNATSDTITATGRFDSDLVPSTDSTRSLGSATMQWSNLHVATGSFEAVSATQITASAIRVTELDVVTINSINQTEATLEIEDKLIVAAVSASSDNADGGGLRIGGADGQAAGHASVLWSHGSSSLNLNVNGEVQVQVKDGSVLPGKDDNVDLGSSTVQFKDLYLDGTANIDALVADTADIDGGTIDGAIIGGNSAAAGTFTNLVAGGDVDLGDATSDTVTFTGRVDSDFLPSTDSTRDLGSSTLQWAEAHIDHGHIDAITATGTSTLTTVDINGGAIDGTVIGANSAEAGTFTSLVAGGNVDLGDATSDTITATGRFDSDLVPSTDSERALGSATLQWSAAHVDVGHIDQLGSALDANSQAITNINVDSGAIDGTAIGANSHSTAKVTTLEATSTVTLSSLAALSASVADSTHHLLVVDSDDNIIKIESMPHIVGSFANKFAGNGVQEAEGVLSIEPVIEMATKFSRGAILSNDFATASLAHVPLSGSLQVFLNGMLQTPSGSTASGPQDYTGVLSGSSTHSEALWDYRHLDQTGSHYVYFQEPIDEDDVVQLRYLKN